MPSRVGPGEHHEHQRCMPSRGQHHEHQLGVAVLASFRFQHLAPLVGRGERHRGACSTWGSRYKVRRACIASAACNPRPPSAPVRAAICRISPSMFCSIIQMASSCLRAYAADTEGGMVRNGMASARRGAHKQKQPCALKVSKLGQLVENSGSARSLSPAPAWTKAGCPNGEPRTTTPRWASGLSPRHTSSPRSAIPGGAGPTTRVLPRLDAMPHQSSTARAALALDAIVTSSVGRGRFRRRL